MGIEVSSGYGIYLLASDILEETGKDWETVKPDIHRGGGQISLRNKSTDLILVEIEFDGLQLPYCVGYTPNLVFREIDYIQMPQAAKLGWQCSQLVPREAQGLQGRKLPKGGR